MNSTASAALNTIATNLEPLANLNTSTLAKLLNNYAPLLALLTGALVALVSLAIRDWYTRAFHRSKIIPGKDEPNEFTSYQEAYASPGGRTSRWISRLVFSNDSGHTAEGIEIYVQEIRDNNGKKRESFIPAPLRWTHRDVKPRDVFPKQIVMLDLLESCSRDVSSEPIVLATPNLEGIKNMRNIKKGNTTLLLQSYQKDGRNPKFEVKLSWNGQEIKSDNLPQIKSFSLVGK